MKDMKLAVRRKGGPEFIPLTVDDGWAERHDASGEDEAVALAMAEAAHGVEVFELVTRGGQELASVRLTTSIPDGSVSLINPELGTVQGLSCFICLCDANGNCVCTPC